MQTDICQTLKTMIQKQISKWHHPIRVSNSQQAVIRITDEVERQMERRAIGPFRAAHALAETNQAVIDGGRHIESDKETVHGAYVMPKPA